MLSTSSHAHARAPIGHPCSRRTHRARDSEASALDASALAAARRTQTSRHRARWMPAATTARDVTTRAHPRASKRAKAKRAPDPGHPKRKYTVDERLAHKGVDVERMRSGGSTTTSTPERGVFACDVPSGTEVCELVAELDFRQDAEGWPAQGSDAWWFARASVLTASDVGKVLGIDARDKHGADGVLEKKLRIRARERELEAKGLSELEKELSADSSSSVSHQTNDKEQKQKKRTKRKGSSWKGPPAVVHGNTYESEALAHYEAVHGTKCFTFGLKIHDAYFWLGASPDGVHPHGRIVEIKCPYSRPIVPVKRALEHMAQIQILLECFDMDTCDFVQYKPAGRGRGRSGDLDAPAYLCESIPRDREWFAANLPALEKFAQRLPTPSL